MSGVRRQGRDAALQILYFWEIGRTEPEAAIDAYFAEHQPAADPEVVEFAARLVLGTTSEIEAIDAIIAGHSLHWRVDRLATIDRLILRMAIWELRHEPETPGAVVLNEALELARRYSTPDAVRFVNGILDAVKRASS